MFRIVRFFGTPGNIPALHSVPNCFSNDAILVLLWYVLGPVKNILHIITLHIYTLYYCVNIGMDVSTWKYIVHISEVNRYENVIQLVM